MVGRLLSVWEGLFSRAMLVLGRVHVYNIHDVQIPHEYPLSLWWISDMEVVRQLDESAPKLPNGIHTEALALCTMLLDSGIIPLNHVDVAWLQLWMFSLRLCCWNAAVLLWYLGYLLYLFHGRFSINVFFDILLTKVNGQTALCYAARQVRVKQMRGSQWAVVVHRVYGIICIILRQWSFVLTAVWNK